MPRTIRIETFRFTPAELKLEGRRPGISAFMRVRNGAFSVEAAIRSHIDHFDEIVVVHNRSTDATPDILERLALELGPKLRLYHYLPPVFPPGSEGHIREPADSPLSLVNYYNLALCLTNFAHVTKLDDDHVAMTSAMARLVADIRSGRAGRDAMACFSGLNLARDVDGRIGVLHHEPFAGNGDHWIFPVGAETYFGKDRRFETLRKGAMTRRFHSFAYWHLKYLKPGFGFANYDLAQNPQSRYARRLTRLEQGVSVEDPLALVAERTVESRLRRWVVGMRLPTADRDRLIVDRERASQAFVGLRVEDIAQPDDELAPFLLQTP